jgi:hypothetical protein
MWAPLFAAGVLTALWMSRRTAGAPRRMGPPAERRRRRRRAHGVICGAARLCAAVVGNDKGAVASILGPPRATAGFAALAPAMLVVSDAFRADTWYYPLDRARRQALVIRFENDIAREAQLVQAPAQPR